MRKHYTNGTRLHTEHLGGRADISTSGRRFGFRTPTQGHIDAMLHREKQIAVCDLCEAPALYWNGGPGGKRRAACRKHKDHLKDTR